MIGAADIGDCLKEDGEFDDLAGITPRAVSELFRLLKERSAQITYIVLFYFYMPSTLNFYSILFFESLG